MFSFSRDCSSNCYTPNSQMADARKKLVPRHENEALKDKQLSFHKLFAREFASFLG